MRANIDWVLPATLMPIHLCLSCFPLSPGLHRLCKCWRREKEPTAWGSAAGWPNLQYPLLSIAVIDYIINAKCLLPYATQKDSLSLLSLSLYLIHTHLFCVVTLNNANNLSQFSFTLLLIVPTGQFETVFDQLTKFLPSS